MTTSEQLIHLAQNDQIRNFLRDYSPLELITVYAAPEAEDPTDDGLVVFPALIPANRVQSVLNNSNWVLRVGGGLPYFEDADPTAGIEPNYFPHINHDGVEALVHVRSFLGARAGYVEISEEFRLFHNLYHDDLSGKFLKFDEAGLEEIVATATDNSECVRIRLKELRQFLAAKQMHLVLQHESTVRSTKDLSELGIQLGNSGLEKSSNACWSLAYGPSHAGDESMASLSRLHCNRIVAPFDLADGRIPGYGSALLPRFEEFAIDTDELGDQIRHTCDPQTLKANAIDRPQAPTFLTPVAFRKSVLDRYYENPSKYSIKSGHLACGGFWSIRIDNHHEDKVVAWLGDLGQSLPHTEQLHWRAHNFVDPGGVSEVNYRRQIRGEWVSSDQPEHTFSDEYQALMDVCDEKLGWPILLPLHEDDLGVLDSIRVPSTTEQTVFDHLVLGLAKVIVDSLNGQKMKDICAASGGSVPDQPIGQLRDALIAAGAKSYEPHIEFLRTLQSLRSAGSAHRKGKRFDALAAKYGLNRQDRRATITGLLEGANQFLQYLNRVVTEGCDSWISGVR